TSVNPIPRLYNKDKAISVRTSSELPHAASIKSHAVDTTMSSSANTHVMVTRFRGTKRPFLGERLDGVTTPKPKRRKRVAKTNTLPKRVNIRYKLGKTGQTVWNGPGGPQVCNQGFEPWNWPKVTRDAVTGYGIAEVVKKTNRLVDVFEMAVTG
ncbi:MAG: hypothetical protein Q9210_006083, partial [Variospora velana]